MTIFTPTAAGVQLTNVNASASVALGVGSGVGGYVVRVVNATDKDLFIQFGNSAVSAVADTSMIVKFGAVPPSFFSIGPGVTHAAAVAVGGASTGKIHFIIGKGE
jgi:hypothetical protein